MTRPPLITRSAHVQEVEATGRAEFDLRRPPTRAETGIEDGQDIAIFQARGRQPIATVVHLPGDATFTFAASHLDVVARGTDGPPAEVRMQATYPSLDEARAELERGAGELGGDGGPASPDTFDAEAVARWYESRRAHYGDAADDRSFANDVFRGRPHGEVTSEITASLSGSGDVTVLYSFKLPEP